MDRAGAGRSFVLIPLDERDRHLAAHGRIGRLELDRFDHHLLIGDELDERP